MQTARTALQDEFEQLLSELEASQSSVASLEAQVRGEGERRGAELSQYADVIRDLQKQLECAEEQRNTARQEVSDYIAITLSWLLSTSSQ